VDGATDVIGRQFRSGGRHAQVRLQLPVHRGRSVTADGADFEDGYRACIIADAFQESAHTEQRVGIPYAPQYVAPNGQTVH